MRACSRFWPVLAIAASLVAAPLHAELTQFVYVASLASYDVSGHSDVFGYRIDPSTGALTPIVGSPFPAGVGAFSVAVDPSGQFAYVANSFSDNVSAYTINPITGALTAIAGSPFPAEIGPNSVAVDPSGKFAYVANAGGNCNGGNVSGYTINATTGALTAIAGSPFTAGNNPYTVAVDPSGKFAYVANSCSNDVWGFTINPSTGALTPIAGSPFPAGGGARGIVVDLGQRHVGRKFRQHGKEFAYVANFQDDNVSGYTIDASTGALTPIPGSPFPAGFGPNSMTVDPGGQFAYVADGQDDTVSAYTINQVTGALTAVTGSPFPSVVPAFVAVDPGGNFAYVVPDTAPLFGNISGYRIDPNTGALTPIAGSPFHPPVLSPAGIAITTERFRLRRPPRHP